MYYGRSGDSGHPTLPGACLAHASRVLGACMARAWRVPGAYACVARACMVHYWTWRPTRKWPISRLSPVRYRCTMVDWVIVVTPRCLARASRMPHACWARAWRVPGACLARTHAWQEHAWCTIGHGDLRVSGRASLEMGVNRLLGGWHE